MASAQYINSEFSQVYEAILRFAESQFYESLCSRSIGRLLAEVQE